MGHLKKSDQEKTHQWPIIQLEKFFKWHQTEKKENFDFYAQRGAHLVLLGIQETFFERTPPRNISDLRTFSRYFIWEERLAANAANAAGVRFRPGAICFSPS